jgi:neutral ceramidase
MIRMILRWTLLLLTISPLGAALRAGAFAADITPREWPVRLIGNFGLTLAHKAADPLHARALVLDDGRTKLAIVVVDSCYVPRALLDAAKSRAAKATGIATSHMLISATHTHSAPPSRKERGSVSGTTDPPTAAEIAYVDLLEQQIAQSIIEANKRLQPAEIGWGVRQEPDELNNRRWYMTPGTIPPDPFGGRTDKVRMNPPSGSKDLVKPAGPTDPGFSVVCVRTKAGKPLAVLGNYSLHYVGGTPPNEVSADYFGEFAKQIGERLAAGPEFVGILSNGTSGDVNNIDFRTPRPRSATYERIRIVAGKLADSAMAAYKEAKYSSDAPLRMEQRELPIRFRKPTPAQLERARQFLAEPDEKKLPQRAKPYAEFVLTLNGKPEFADVKLQTIRAGNLAIAAIPCEVFSETGLEIKAKSPFATTFTIELANGHYGYMPTPEQHELGGYETWMGTNQLEKDASRKMVASLLEMFARMKQ